jgi:hypothetical protein
MPYGLTSPLPGTVDEVTEFGGRITSCAQAPTVPNDKASNPARHTARRTKRDVCARITNPLKPVYEPNVDIAREASI